MKRLLLLVPSLLLATSLQELLQGLEDNQLLKAKGYEAEAREHLYKAAKAKDLPSLDLFVEAIYLKEQPTISLHLPLSQFPSSFPAASKRQMRGEIAISYPLFSGYAITALIQKEQFAKERSALERKDLKRRLFFQTARLYGALYAVQRQIEAIDTAIKALKGSLQKAQGFYKEQLLPLSDLKDIQAKLYEATAKGVEARNMAQTIRQRLFYLTKIHVKRVLLPQLKLPSDEEVGKRADIKALKKMVQIDKSDIALARSAFYPKVALRVALRGYGDSLSFKGDGYRNGDESYVGVRIEQNLFSGGGDKERVEAAKAKRAAASALLEDYIQRAKTTLQIDKKTLQSLEAKRAWAKKEVEAKRSYYELIKGRFESQLCSADELSRAIASLEEAKANKAAIEAQIFTQKAKILLDISLEDFKKALGL